MPFFILGYCCPDPGPRGSKQPYICVGRSSDLRIILLAAPSH